MLLRVRVEEVVEAMREKEEEEEEDEEEEKEVAVKEEREKGFWEKREKIRGGVRKEGERVEKPDKGVNEKKVEQKEDEGKKRMDREEGRTVNKKT